MTIDVQIRKPPAEKPKIKEFEVTMEKTRPAPEGSAFIIAYLLFSIYGMVIGFLVGLMF